MEGSGVALRPNEAAVVRPRRRPAVAAPAGASGRFEGGSNGSPLRHDRPTLTVEGPITSTTFVHRIVLCNCVIGPQK